MKKAIMDMILECESHGAKRKRICELLQIEERRVRRWFSRGSLEDGKPGPVHALHALLPEEREAIIALAKDKEYADDSHRVLTAHGIDSGRIGASFSTVYRVMRSEGLTTDRNGHTRRTGRSRKPDRPELTGPNQRWCWDISYLRTYVSGIFLYLYVLLDEYSRKVVAYRVSWYCNHKEGQELIEEGLEKEGLTQEQIEILSLFNDRGSQMKAKPMKVMLKELGISQVFSRPRTPNDNPFIESLFSTVKCSPEYPGAFQDDIGALAYFMPYFDYYNNVRLHGKIGYVTPAQRHCGVDKAIRALRRQRCTAAREERLRRNREMFELVPTEQGVCQTMTRHEIGNPRPSCEVVFYPCSEEPSYEEDSLTRKEV